MILYGKLLQGLLSMDFIMSNYMNNIVLICIIIIITIKDGVEVFILFTILILFLRHYVSHPHLNDTKLFSLRNVYSKIIDPNEVKNDNKLRFNYH